MPNAPAFAPVIEDIFDSAHVDAVITAGGGTPGVDDAIFIAGLSETSLDETLPLPGSPFTTIWGTPSDGAGTFDKAASNVGHDWDASGGAPSGIVSADINDFGIAGMLATPADPTYFDYQDSFHWDLNFRQGPSGQFDASTVFVPDPDQDFAWQGIMSSSEYRGLDQVGLDSQINQEGTGTTIAGTILQVSFPLFNANNQKIELNEKGLAHLFATLVREGEDPTVVIPPRVLGNDPSNNWIQLEQRPGLGAADPLLAGWDPEIESLGWEWLTPARASDILGLFETGEICDGSSEADCDADYILDGGLNGDWYLRFLLFNRPAAGDPLVCANNAQCLSGDELLGPNSNYLIDFTPPHLDDDGDGNPVPPAADQLLASGKVILKQPKPIKADVFILETIDGLLAGDPPGPPSDQKSIQDLNKARSNIEDSIDDLFWLDDVRLITGDVSIGDERNAKFVFQKEESATVNLMKILGLPTSGKRTDPQNIESPDFLAKVRELVVLIETVDRIIAENHIEDAESSPTATTAECLTLADEQMDLATSEATFERFNVAIDHRGNAWDFANKALKGQSCEEGSEEPPPPSPPAPTEQPEVDETITLIAQLTDDKKINKGVSKMITELAQDLKVDLIGGDDAAACIKLNDLEDIVFENDKVEQEAQDKLLNNDVPPTTGSTKAIHAVIAVAGCIDTADV